METKWLSRICLSHIEEMIRIFYRYSVASDESIQILDDSVEFEKKNRKRSVLGQGSPTRLSEPS